MAGHNGLQAGLTFCAQRTRKRAVHVTVPGYTHGYMYYGHEAGVGWGIGSVDLTHRGLHMRRSFNRGVSIWGGNGDRTGGCGLQCSRLTSCAEHHKTYHTAHNISPHRRRNVSEDVLKGEECLGDATCLAKVLPAGTHRHRTVSAGDAQPIQLNCAGGYVQNLSRILPVQKHRPWRGCLQSEIPADGQLRRKGIRAPLKVDVANRLVGERGVEPMDIAHGCLKCRYLRRIKDPPSLHSLCAEIK